MNDPSLDFPLSNILFLRNILDKNDSVLFIRHEIKTISLLCYLPTAVVGVIYFGLVNWVLPQESFFHKMFRLFVLYFMCLVLFLNLLLFKGIYLFTMILQIVFYASAYIGYRFKQFAKTCIGKYIEWERI